ncbi:MAG: tRNA-binding protein [Candidatus Berkiella sp.]
MSDLITFEDFSKVKICAGLVIDAVLNQKAKKPAYKLTIDFGPLGVKLSSAQITEHYTPLDLIGHQVIAVMNFAPKKVAGVVSEVLVLACVCEQQGTILLQPTQPVPNGTPVL